MRVFRSIGDLRTRDVGTGLIKRLLAICPEGDHHGVGFEGRLPDDDPRTEMLLAALRRAGLQQEPTGKYKVAVPGKQFASVRYAHYEPADFEAARFISWDPSGLAPRFDIQNEGEPPVRLLSLEESFGKTRFASTNFGHLIATLRGRAALEGSEFVGMSFVPGHFVDERDDLDQLRDMINSGASIALGEPTVWEVRPTITLPAMLPIRYPCRIAGEDRLSRNPIDLDRRMAYSRLELDGLGPFDFARPSLTENPRQDLIHPLVVSQRLFQFMRKHECFELTDGLPIREE